MQLFDLSLRLNGYDISKADHAISSIQALDNRAYIEYLNTRKKEIVNYHLNNNPFYQQLTKNIAFGNWNQLPVMTKGDLQQPLISRLSNGFSKSTVYVNKTSGSVGHPFIFAKDKWCHALTWAIIKNRYAQHGIDLNNSKQARFYGIPKNGVDYYKERLKDWFSDRFRFSVFDLSDKAFDQCYNSFSKNKFDHINGYTSAIVQFAKYLDRKNLALKSVCTSLKACFVTSEMLFDDDKKLMELRFGVPIINEYGASELDLIAFQSPDNSWLLNNETLFVEILDNEDKVVPDGEEGRIVITSLYNKAHPFIRYDIGDIGIKSTSSTIQRPILKTLVGRTNDIAVLPSGRKASGLTFYYITKSIIEDDGLVKELVVEQNAVDKFKVKYVSSEDLKEKKINIIKKAMENYLEPGIHITFEKQNKLIRQKSGKLKQFVSNLKHT